jgi:hypothetical protein
VLEGVLRGTALPLKISVGLNEYFLASSVLQILRIHLARVGNLLLPNKPRNS